MLSYWFAYFCLCVNRHPGKHKWHTPPTRNAHVCLIKIFLVSLYLLAATNQLQFFLQLPLILSCSL